ncbi:S-layer homology domain-containing protein [Oscillibacter sp. MSJ-31]|uniref:S-layer homology domain-containing protein n=1 Tax=Oscillibacter sp. MSJ-31 TaxID=2841526 RepID=UPI001C1135E5|nr:S-layer homology domain-containing protein [Oscillibacter sp. MSJ-31]MBU5458502.1 S-layer homology domain-containing protein [Oscillibacter sp. MSJ-31]
MKIWKRLLGLALCLCAAACVLCVGASAADHTDHPICGKTHKEIGDHTETCGNVTWAAWNGTDMDASKDHIQLTEGNYYLPDTLTVSDTIHVSGTVSLCLNGKKLSGNTYGLIVLDENATLNICDCKGGGEIELSASGDSSTITYDNQTSSSNKLNLYGGTISRTGGSNISCVLKAATSSQLTFNMYGGYIHNNNTGARAAVNMHVSTGTRTVSIYGGKIRNEGNYGIEMNEEGEQLYIAGGTLESRANYAVFAVGGSQLILSGKPTIKTDSSSWGAICSPMTHRIQIESDFEPKEPVSISQSWGAGVFAVPAVTGGSLADKAQYFVSAEEGYFVECNSGGNLQLTACAITKDPTADNDYTVTANGSPTYQWYSATKGDVPVTDAVVKSKGDLFYSSRWIYLDNSLPATGKVTGFTLTMKKGDELTLDFSRSYDIRISEVTLSDGRQTIPGVEDEDLWQKKYTLTAPADGDYTLTISASAEPMGGEPSYASLSFTAKVTADVPGDQLDGQTAATLNTTGLSGGSYICRVTWEGKTTLNSQVVSYTAPQHTHSWSTDWTSDATNHWHKCFICNDKNDIVAHTYDQEVAVDGYKKSDATCTAKATYYKSCVCGAKGTEMFESGGLLAHDFTGGTWKSDANNHWKNCANCDAESDKVQHNFSKSGNTYTCTACGYAYTVPSPSSSSGGSSTPTITVPVTGSRDTVQISASVSGSAAEVKEIKKIELDKIGTDRDVVIDLSGLSKSVTGVTLPTDTIRSISESEADGVTIKLPNAELRVDQKTLAAVSEQAKGSKVQLVVETDSKAKDTMTAAQKQALDGMKNAAALEAYFISNGQRIRDFNGGEVELSIPYQASGAIRAWYLKEDGTREPVSARYDKENARLILRHFSHYVIEELDSGAAYTVCAKDDTCPLAAFGDLTATAWYHDGVHYCLENGLMQGVSATSFLPNGSTTRAQLVTVLWRLEGSPETTSAVSFGDVADGAWYAKAVRWAAGSGVVKGYDSEHFGPDDAVTREQMVTILYRYAQYKGADVSVGEDTNILSFADAMTVSEYAIPAMQWACGSGLVTGIARDGGMILAPKDTTTRVQMATLMMRFYTECAK